MSARRLRFPASLLLLALAAQPIASQEEAVPSEAAQLRPEAREALDALREDIAQRRFEHALTSIKKLLADPGVRDEERVQALLARAQVHVARAELSGAEKDYRELLVARPGLVWDDSYGPAKARTRFEMARKAVVGTIRVDRSPPDAVVSIDGREAHAGSDGAIALAAGTHRLDAVHSGYDPLELTIEVLSERETPVAVRLSANSRPVVVRTEQEGVQVALDGKPVGETTRTSAGGPELRLEEVPIGEHVFELRKPCYSTELVTLLLTVDLLERAPAVLGPVSLEPQRGIVELRGVPRAWQVLLNGAPVARPADDRLAVCPGALALEVRTGGRSVFLQEAELEADAELAFDVLPRPNLLLLGLEKIPDSLGTAFSVRTGAAPAPDLDLTKAADWQRVALPPDTDLVLAALPAGSFFYSPILGIAGSLPSIPERLERPSWHATTLGVTLADSRVGGTCRVLSLLPDGAAARAGILRGDRIQRIAQEAVTSTEQALARIGEQRPGTPFPVEILRNGESRSIACTGSDTLVLDPSPASALVAALHAGWASVDAAALPEAEASAAWANLALLLGRSGKHAESAAAWSHVAWGERAGIGAGTAAYYLGVEAAALGETEQARAAFEKAARSKATTLRDEGRELAPAARDHLADKPTAR